MSDATLRTLAYALGPILGAFLYRGIAKPLWQAARRRHETAGGTRLTWKRSVIRFWWVVAAAWAVAVTTVNAYDPYDAPLGLWTLTATLAPLALVAIGTWLATDPLSGDNPT